MFRVIGFAFLFAVFVSFLTHGNQIAIALSFFGVLALAIYPLVTGRTALRCQHCGKRVKLGYTTCHHCGQPAVRAGS